MLLHTQKPYSFPLMLDIMARYPAPSLFSLGENAYYRALHTENGIALAKVSSQADTLEIESLIGEINPAQLGHILGTDIDLSPFYDFASQDKALSRLIEPLYGLPIDRYESVYHALIFVIIEQHISWVNAQKAQRWLVEWAGNFVEYQGQSYYAMPRPEQIANASIEDLKPLKVTFKRMEMLIEISQRMMSGDLDLEGMRKLRPEEMYRELLKIKGVGHWTAAVVVSRAQGIFPYVAQNDVALQAAAREYFGIEKSPNATQNLFATYGEFAGLAAHFTLMRWVLDKYPIVTKIKLA